MDYEKAKQLSTDPDARVRREVAQQPKVKPEILFYLADDGDTEVRQAVAANRATPRHADLILTRDEDETVRARLAAKIVALVPEFAAEERERIRELSHRVLETLARDHAAKVRQKACTVSIRHARPGPKASPPTAENVSAPSEARM